MDESDKAALEDTIRRMSAELTAHQFLIEVLLANMIARLGQEHGAAFIADLLRVGGKTEELPATSDAQAEQMADIAVRSHERLVAIVQRAQERAR